MGSVLVLIASQQSVFAQDDIVEEPLDESVDEIVVEEPVEVSGTIAVPLSGMGQAVRIGNLSATPSTTSLGVVEIGETVNTEVVLTHTGGTDSPAIEIGAVDVFGQSAAELSTSFGGFTSLSPGESITVGIAFTPAVTGSKSGGLTLEVAGATAPFVILLEAQARYPYLAEIGSSESSLGFGQVFPNLTSSRSVVLTNTGEEGAPMLNVLSAQITGEHASSFEMNFEPVVLASGELYEFDITLQDAAVGVKQATLAIEHDGNNFALSIPLEGKVVTPADVPVSFDQKNIATDIDNGTTLAFGPDDKLYIGQQDGSIHVFNAQRSGNGNYSVNKLEVINLIKNVQNHDDDGDVNNAISERLLTGIYLTGTAAQPVIWAASSDPRIGGGPSGADKNLDTNSGILHKLTKSGGTWSKQDVVRGLPRSEENHASNGITFKDGKLLLMSGGFTNSGLPSNNFAETSEYALSAALLEIDVDAIGNSTYDLPTLDDEDRPGDPDNNDPFGGNNGKNQAMLVSGGPVQIYSPGYRNAYDIVLTQSGRLYTFDNGPNAGWGGEAGGAACSNDYMDGGKTHIDHLHYITRGFYAGHPNPVRGNKSNTFNDSNPQSPIEVAANPDECQYKGPKSDGSLTSIQGSTNGIDEYTADNFFGTMVGDIIAVTLSSKAVTRVELNGAGTKATSKETIANLSGAVAPLDLVVQGEDDLFPGTIWVVDFQNSDLFVLEPDDY